MGVRRGYDAVIDLPPPLLVERPAIIQQIGRDIAPDRKFGVAFAPGFRKPAGGPATLAFQAITTNPTEGQTITFTSVGIGAAAANRYVFITIPYYNGGGSNISIASVTIGGVLATIHAQPFNVTTSTRGGCALVSALVPTGTTADVVVTYSVNSGSYYRPRIAVYRVTNLKSTTPYDLVTETGGNYQYPRSKNLNVIKDGFAIVGCYIIPNASATLSGVTQDYKVAPFTNAVFIGGGNTITSTSTISVTIGGSVLADPALVMASFR